MRKNLFILPFLIGLCIAPQLIAQNKKEKSSKRNSILKVAPLNDLKITNDGLTVLYGNATVQKLRK